ncbi:MAG: methyltransferase family protein [Burkholderiaceae bacterium]
MKTTTKMALATTAFALVHSALASRVAKRQAARLLGQRQSDAFYRIFFVAQSVLGFASLVAYGARLPRRTLYRVTGPAALLLRAGQAGGLVCLYAAARQPGVAHLAGIRNLRAWRPGLPIPPGPYAQGPERGPDGRLTVTGPYRWSRHPLNFCGIPIFWLTPHMTTRLLAFNLVGTAYFMLGSVHEEARLAAAYGERYRQYQLSDVPFFWPSPARLI